VAPRVESAGIGETDQCREQGTRLWRVSNLQRILSVLAGPKCSASRGRVPPHGAPRIASAWFATWNFTRRAASLEYAHRGLLPRSLLLANL